ncbi:lysE: L-lysine exporter protein [Desulfosarcina variabilis str. Montpellier]
MIGPFLQGAGVGAGLIIAIGAQNAFVLSQGVRRNYPLLIALICWWCDCVLILAGMAGMGKAVATHPQWMRLAAWGGAAFLLVYGFRSLQAAFAGGRLETGGTPAVTARSAVLTTLAVTLLNPHVYLDTVVLLGSLSGQFPGTGRYAFATGAIMASFVWFLSLSLGARILAPLFRHPAAWRVLDSLVCLTMWSIAASLVFQNWFLDKIQMAS